MSEARPTIFIALILCLGPCGIAAAAPAGPQVSFEQGPGEEAVLSLVVPPLRWETAPGGLVPHIEGFGRLAQRGLPDLPARRERIAIPPGGRLEILEVTIDWSEGMLPGHLALHPAAERPRGPVSPPAALDAEGYWPARTVEISVADGALRTLRFSSVAIRPLQIQPEHGRFRVARRIEVRVRRQRPLGGASPAPPPGPAASVLDALAAGAIHGAGSVGRQPLGVSAPRSPRSAAEASPQPSGLAATLAYPAWRLEVDEEGLYRLSYAWAQANAPLLLDFLTSRDPRRLRLVTQGVEIPIVVDGEADGSFDDPTTRPPDGDAIVFYGQPVGEVDLFDPTVWERGDLTDINVYRLETADAPLRVSDSAAAPTGGLPLVTSFRETVQHDENEKFLGFVPEDDVDHWYVDPFLNTNTGVDELIQDVATPDHVGGSISLRARLLGFDYEFNLHRSELYVDGALVDTADWDGYVEFTHGVDQGPVYYTPASPLGALTAVKIRLPFDRPEPEITKDIVGVNWIEIDYDRRIAARNDRLNFDLSNDSSQEADIDNHSALPEVWEVTETTLSPAGMEIALPRRLTGLSWSGGQARLRMDRDAAAPATRHFSAAAGSGFLAPRAVAEDVPPSSVDPLVADDLADASNGADWLIIGQRDLIDMSSGTQLRALLAHRQLQGLATAVVDVQDTYDQFTYGIVDPQAIRDFIETALNQWSPAPSYVVLLGDATWDFKNHYGHVPARQYVPTKVFAITSNSQFSFYLSDTWYAAVIGTDTLPDAVIGRWPAHNLIEAEEMFRKVLWYEDPLNHDVSWTGKACLVSERDDTDLIRVHDEIYDQWFTSGPQVGDKVYERDKSEFPPPNEEQQAADEANVRIDACINSGAAIVTFAGHGGYKTWGRGASLFTTDHPDADDLVDLIDDRPLVFTVQANCITGHFAQDSSVGSTNDSWYTHLEDWMTTPHKAAIAGMAPSFLAYSYQIDNLLDPIYEGVFGPRKERLIGALDMRLRLGFDSLSDDISIRSFVLQGDPALSLAVPRPSTPTIQSIDQAGSGELLITWTGGADADHFHVYRARSYVGPYTLVGDDILGNSFLDTGLDNCSEYFYYVVGVDLNGFESRQSNFNEGCAEGSPDPSDCKSGIPENPDPPATPNLLRVTDTERGQQLEVEWKCPLCLPDVEFFRVQWGTSDQGPYPNEKRPAAPQTTTLVNGLDNETEYFFVVRAEHCSQIGPASNQLSGVPHLVRGINPPRSIGDLRVHRVGSDALLEWSLPTDTVWGIDTTVLDVRVHGSDQTPAYVTNDANKLADLPGSATSWTHGGQAVPDGVTRYYLVIARNGTGQWSASGVELPAAVEDLALERLGASELSLHWGPVTGTMDGRRLEIAGYNVYGRNSVLPRTEASEANLLQGSVPPSPGTVTTTLPLPGEAFFSYQVLAFDHHATESVW
ncbi:MAG: hypothetical protein JSV80_14140 [Acidobacteriota bacterium]|nr:MAG: hypothetical protein JSV80_14140 [Acidobacteriota bacterium]